MAVVTIKIKAAAAQTNQMPGGDEGRENESRYIKIANVSSFELSSEAEMRFLCYSSHSLPRSQGYYRVTHHVDSNLSLTS